MSNTLIEPAARRRSPAEPSSPSVDLARRAGADPGRAVRPRIPRSPRRCGWPAACTLAPFKKVGSPLLERFAENERFLSLAARPDQPVGGRRRGRGSTPNGSPITSTSFRKSCWKSAATSRAATTKQLPKLATPPLAGYPRIYSLALSLVAHTDSEVDETRLTRIVRPVPGGHAAVDRRIVGLADDAPAGPAGEPPPARRADALGLGRAAPGRPLGGRGAGRGGRPRRRGRRRRAQARRAAGPDRPDRPVRRPPVATPARPGRRAPPSRSRGSNRSWRRAGPTPTKSSSASTAGRPPTRSPSATASSASGSSRRWTGTPSSSGTAPSRRSSGATRTTSTPCKTSPPATATAGPSRRIARGSGADEAAVASRAVALARDGRGQGGGRGGTSAITSSTRGLPALEGGVRLPAPLARPAPGLDAPAPPDDLLRLDRLVCSSCSWRLGGPRHRGGRRGRGGSRRSCSSLLLPVGEIAVGLVNHLLTLFLPPRVLPKLDFKDGIGADCATFVVMPSMLIRPAERRDAAGTAGDPPPRQPRPATPVRPPDRLRRRPRRDDARGRRLRRRRPGTGQGA